MNEFARVLRNIIRAVKPPSVYGNTYAETGGHHVLLFITKLSKVQYFFFKINLIYSKVLNALVVLSL